MDLNFCVGYEAIIIIVMAIQAQLYSENIGFQSCGGSPDFAWIDNGCGAGGGGGFNQVCFDLPQKPQPYQQQLQQQMQQLQTQRLHRNQQNLLCDDGFIVSPLHLKNNTSNQQQSVGFSQTMAAYFEKQGQEIDQFIKLQNDRLRVLLQEQRKQQLSAIVKKIEENASIMFRRKDEEIAKAVNKSMELENLLHRLEMENQSWQRVAQENEAMIVSLNSALEQMRERACCCVNRGAEDAESCCDLNTEETEQNRGVPCLDGKEKVVEEEDEDGSRRKTTMVCRSCNSRESCVLFLPCRHLCSCRNCEAFLDSCPVCRTPKKASIEALIF